MYAINYYRENKLASTELKEKWDNEIKQQDYLYKLSKEIHSNIKLPNNILSSFIPRPHQKVAIEFGKLTNGNFIIADQQRTGKTYSALLYVLSQNWNNCLIICPSKVCNIWKKMILDICGKDSKILKSNDEIELGFNIVSYDLLHTIENRNCDIAIADEGHFFVNGTARRAQAVYDTKAEKKIVLSGTPILNSVYEMLSILKWIRPDLVNEFNNFIEINEKIGINNYEISRNLGKELRRRCLLLRETNQVSESNDVHLNFIEIDANISDRKNLQEIGKAKVDFAVEYLTSFQNKILVGFYYKETGRMLKARLGNKAVLIDGSSSRKEIKDALEAFQGDKQYLLGSTVIAEGLDFSHADQLLMLEESSFSLRTDQMRERINKLGKTNNIIDIVICPGTQDDRLYNLINNKFNISHGIRDS